MPVLCIHLTTLFTDFGLERLLDVTERTNFPWLMSNVDDNETNQPLADGIVTHTMDWHGWKIGLVSTVLWVKLYVLRLYETTRNSKITLWADEIDYDI